MPSQVVSNILNKLHIHHLLHDSISKGKTFVSNGQNLTFKLSIFAVSGTVFLTFCVAFFKWRKLKDQQEMGDRMKGVAAWKYDGIKGLEVRKNLRKPQIKEPDEVLIEVRAVSVDPIDVRILHGYARVLHSYFNKFNKFEKNEFPIIPGRECSGIIVEIGNNVHSLKKGDQVWAFAAPWHCGLMTEYVVLKESQVDVKPSNLSFETAASLPYAALLTWDALVRHAKLGPNSTMGKRVLIHIGSSACGSLAIQMIKQWGGHVTTTVPTYGLPLVRMLGADDVIVYSVTDFRDELLSREKFDVVINTVGSVIHELCVGLCVPGGNTVSTVVTFPGENNHTNIWTASWKFLKSIAKEILKSQTKSAHFGHFIFDKLVLSKIKELVQTEKLKPVVEEVFEFEKSVLAFERVAGGDSVGRTVIKIS